MRLRETQAMLDASGDHAALAETNLRLTRALFDSGETTDGIDAYIHAAATGQSRSRHRHQIIDELTSRMTAAQLYDDAIKMLQGELRVPTNGRLWRRLGIVRWYGHYLNDAYSSLTTDRSCGVAAARVGHARGQVLSEMGQHRKAWADLETAKHKR